MTATELVVVANRLLVHRVRSGGKAAWRPSPGGLARAMSSVVRARHGTCVGWAGIDGRPPPPFRHEGIQQVPVRLDREEVRAFYEGMCNRTLWPLYHDAVRHPQFHRRWWNPYVEINERYTETVCKVARRGATVWVNDFHLQLVPALLREKRPDLRIGFFLHIPFPPQELFSQLPWRGAIIRGLLAADVVGFQTALGARNFRQLCTRFDAGTVHGSTVEHDGRETRVDAFPISIDVEHHDRLANDPDVVRRAEDFKRRLGGRRIVLGVDRLDYTKGIDRRLRALAELLRSKRFDPGKWVYVQIGVPSRERVAEYKAIRSRVERLVGQINGSYGEIGRPVVSYMARSLRPPELVALYRAADVLAVTPLRDGMNLVAKEYVASRPDETGALVLSEFSGAARELTSALLVNPHDIDAIANAIHDAMMLRPAEQKRRMRAMRRTVQRHTIDDWSNAFLSALEQ